VLNQVGIVAIGRNEGDRLRQCLLSAVGKTEAIVYVDSGSTDSSRELARSLGVEVVELDLSVPFTAARARNEGFTRLLSTHPAIEFVQLVDGDCEIIDGWLASAYSELTNRPQVAVVCGLRRERSPQESLYNRLCDLEWQTPIGETKACGGDAMMRVTAWRSVGGFNPDLIAGEEPELCLRLRQQGWKIIRLDADMTWHDAQMQHFGQWWQRNVRAGYAYAEGSHLHGQSPERHWVKDSRSIWVWGALLPLVAVGMVWLTKGWSLLLLTAYLLQVVRIARRMAQQNFSTADAWLYARFCVLSRFPQLQGQIQFHASRLLNRPQALIEYKNTTPMLEKNFSLQPPKSNTASKIKAR
jgi:GT2 family glycosyltransferase